MMKRVPIESGEFGIRHASQRDHKRHGWIYKNCYSLNNAYQTVDAYLADNNLTFVLLEIVDHSGDVIDTYSRETE